jgi:hypothetical protein
LTSVLTAQSATAADALRITTPSCHLVDRDQKRGKVSPKGIFKSIV